MKEKFIKFYYNEIETQYLVSNYGRIYDKLSQSFLEFIYPEYVSRHGKQYKLSKPRPTVYIKINNVEKHFHVGRVILLAFNPIENFECMEVDHLDGNPNNNIITNLEWVTHEENMRRAKIHNLFPYGENHHNSKYSDELIHKICIDICNKIPRKEIKDMYKINGQLIDDIRSGRSHRHISSMYIDKGFTYKRLDKDIIKARKFLAEKICEMIESGMSNVEIRENLNLKDKDSCLPNDIRKKRVYKYISDKYNF